MTRYIISQMVALIAVILLAITFLIKSRKTILVINIFTAITYVLQYILLGAYAGVACNAVTILAYIWYYIDEKKEVKSNTTSLIVISLLYVLVGIFTYNTWVDILVIVASIIFAYGVWQKNILIYRWIGVLINVFWFIYNFMYSAWVSLIMESVLGVVKLIGVILYYVENKKLSKKDELKR